MKKPASSATIKKRPATAPKHERVRFYILIGLLILSLALAWFINSGLNQTLSNQFS